MCVHITNRIQGLEVLKTTVRKENVNSQTKDFKKKLSSVSK